MSVERAGRRLRARECVPREVSQRLGRRLAATRACTEREGRVERHTETPKADRRCVHSAAPPNIDRDVMTQRGCSHECSLCPPRAPPATWVDARRGQPLHIKVPVNLSTHVLTPQSHCNVAKPESASDSSCPDSVIPGYGEGNVYRRGSWYSSIAIRSDSFDSAQSDANRGSGCCCGTRKPNIAAECSVEC